ncbi:peptide-methionine (S)-S-oxide reductase MsrA [Thiorhodococcus mannitoliphagus]|uniref:Peptide methionine sulfoxide reductase MsrA n=1 Tax=Thiorhodococcus mannitoliphagus TaxID=329406 RepID=A0A6P1DWY5_9GAMM|nr:peptide-methionine (S)-S-oxide reductase MsrA [Thiorhodococcus mannitoliphagus]NEX20165.1 peptide-methionine (S)-S-oxide reductase MsrA [Thiorhodococcus mannitoliphagus]
MAIETTTLGGGCFWCLEAAFQEVRGVHSVVSGYAGAARPDPTYQQVCSGATGHAEVVQITFDNDQIDFETLLEVFFTIHDPTTLNRQGADAGTQYRSVIFYHGEAQRLTAERVMARLSDAGIWSDPIVTQLEPVPTFYPAESYHQDYFRRNSAQGYCSVVISPKLAKLRSKHADLLTS